MTSGNVSDEPIAFRDDDALERLAPIADLFLLHDRAIETRTDDSVVRPCASAAGSRAAAAAPLARLRARAPDACRSRRARPLLACGAEQKNTFCVAKGDRAWVGHHIGDLEHYATLQAFREGIAHFERLFAVAPEVVAHDLHPDYLSTAYALERDGVELVGVQHHHAHLAACLAEHGSPTATGRRRDLRRHRLRDRRHRLGRRAAGRRPDRLRARRVSCGRCGCPAATAAIRQPWRMAFAWLAEAFGEPPPLPAALRGRVDAGRWDAMAQVGAQPRRVAADLEHGPPVRRRRRAVRPGGRGQLRGPGGGRARGGGLERAAPRRLRDRYSTSGPARPARGRREMARDLAEGAAASRRRRALPRRPGRCHGRGGDRDRRRPRPRDRRAQRRRVPEPAAARDGRGRAATAPGCACSSPSGCRPTTAGSPSARPRWPPPTPLRGSEWQSTESATDSDDRC